MEIVLEYDSVDAKVMPKEDKGELRGERHELCVMSNERLIP
jgi:hypothetical protein